MRHFSAFLVGLLAVPTFADNAGTEDSATCGEHHAAKSLTHTVAAEVVQLNSKSQNLPPIVDSTAFMQISASALAGTTIEKQSQAERLEQSDEVFFDVSTSGMASEIGVGQLWKEQAPFVHPSGHAPLPHLFPFFTHHKSGTMLLRGLADAVGHVLKMPTNVCFGSFECKTDGIVMHQNARLEHVSNIKKTGHAYRGVHLVRDPLSLLASGYIYEKQKDDLVPGAPMVYSPEMLQKLPMNEGICVEAQAAGVTCREMAEVYNKTWADPNMLVVRMEEFHSNFTGTALRIIQHVLGAKEHPGIQPFMKEASELDISKWSASKKKSWSDGLHFADAKEKGLVKDEIHKMQRVASACLSPVQNFEHDLGYGQTGFVKDSTEATYRLYMSNLR